MIFSSDCAEFCQNSRNLQSTLIMNTSK